MNATTLNLPIDASNARSRWGYGLTMPLFLVLFNFLILGTAYFQSWSLFIGATLINGTLLTLTFFIQNRLGHYLAQQYPGLHQTVPRIGFSLLMHVVVSGVFLALIASLYVHCWT